MPFTKAAVLAMPSDPCNEYVAEQVLQWGRAVSVKLQPAAEIQQAWTENAGSSQSTRRDGTTYTAPNYVIMPVIQTPEFHKGDWPQKVIAAMAKRNFTLEFLRSGADASAIFYPNGARPATPDPVVLADAGDAIRRSALLAVQ